MGKGSARRPSGLRHNEEELRWELCKAGTTRERKDEILAQLEELRAKRFRLAMVYSDNTESEEYHPTYAKAYESAMLEGDHVKSYRIKEV